MFNMIGRFSAHEGREFDAWVSAWGGKVIVRRSTSAQKNAQKRKQEKKRKEKFAASNQGT